MGVKPRGRWGMLPLKSRTLPLYYRASSPVLSGTPASNMTTLSCGQSGETYDSTATGRFQQCRPINR